MLFLGFSIVTGGGPTVAARIASAWKAFHTRRRDLTSRCLSGKVRWDRWLMCVGSVLAYGCWGWGWTSEVRARIDHIVHSMVRKMMGGHLEEGEPWLTWYFRTSRQARQKVRDLHGRTFSLTLLDHARRAWMRWLGRDPRTWLGRLVVWRGKADQAHMTELARTLGIPAGDVRRHRIGRPPRRWEYAPTDVWGSTWFDTVVDRDLAPLVDARPFEWLPPLPAGLRVVSDYSPSVYECCVFRRSVSGDLFSLCMSLRARRTTRATLPLSGGHRPLLRPLLCLCFLRSSS